MPSSPRPARSWCGARRRFRSGRPAGTPSRLSPASSLRVEATVTNPADIASWHTAAPDDRLGRSRGSSWFTRPLPSESLARGAVMAPESDVLRNIVLVHGGFVDGSGWESVYHGLRKQGFTVSVVQNPTTSLADDVAATRRVLDQQDQPAILVGHSYGGVVITEAGTDPRVVGLVYIRLCAGCRRVGGYADSGSASGSSGPADSATTGRLSPAGPVEVCRILCRRCKPRSRRVHGGLAGSLGNRSTRGQGEPADLEVEAELVSGGHRGSDDPATGSARHGRTGRGDSIRGCGEPFGLHLTG